MKKAYYFNKEHEERNGFRQRNDKVRKIVFLIVFLEEDPPQACMYAEVGDDHDHPGEGAPPMCRSHSPRRRASTAWRASGIDAKAIACTCVYRIHVEQTLYIIMVMYIVF